MSLKAFHIVFISASSLLAFSLGVWALRGPDSNFVVALIGFGACAAMICYGIWFLRKLKREGVQ